MSGTHKVGEYIEVWDELNDDGTLALFIDSGNGGGGEDITKNEAIALIKILSFMFKLDE